MLKKYKVKNQSFVKLSNVGAFGHLASVIDSEGDPNSTCHLLLIGYSLMRKNGMPGEIRKYHPVIPLGDLASILVEGVKAEIIPVALALDIAARLTDSARANLEAT